MIPDQSNILIVEEELSFRSLCRDLLQEVGYHVEICGSCDEAIAFLQQQPIGLLLTDMNMCGTTYLDILRTAETLPTPADVIIMTDQATVETAIDALKKGACDYLVKPFHPDELRYVVAHCLEHRKTMISNQQLVRENHFLKSGQLLSSIINMDSLVPQILAVLLDEMGGTVGCSFLLDDEETPFIADLKNISVEFAERLTRLLMPQFYDATGLCRSVKNLALELSTLQQNCEQMWILPLRDGDVLRGGIILCDISDDISDVFPSAELSYLCDQINLGFENCCRYRDAQQLMYTDDLTGLYNHRYMHISLNSEIRRSLRYELKFSLLFLDLDRFKVINDNYGHLAGSAALKEVGVLLADCVRDVDTLFRFGGDEFAAILVETDDRTARVVAERIRKVIEEHPFLEKQGMSSYVTVTTGFATFPTDATEKNKLLDLADRAMYAGKGTRNIICGVVDIPDKKAISPLF